MYKIIKILSYIVRVSLCAIILNLVDLTDSFLLNTFIIAPITDRILNLLSYLLCNKTVYQKLNIDNKTIGSFGYAISYCLFVLIFYAILVILKNKGIIPIITEIDTKFINWITEYFNSKIIEFSNKIVEILITTNQ